MNNTHPTKEKVIRAAGSLFYQKGFHATSVRDIAKEAKVNISLISYYFDGKQGLFETIVIDHLEANLKLLEESLGEHFLTIVKRILHYKMDNYQLSCLVHREMMLDSPLLRELLVTYIAKEDSLWAKILFHAEDISDLRYAQELELLQMKGMLQAPFTVPWHQRGERSSTEAKTYFIDKYVENISRWLKGDLFE